MNDTELRQKLEVIRDSYFWRERVFAFADLELHIQRALLDYGRTIGYGAGVFLMYMNELAYSQQLKQENVDERTEA